MSSIEQSAQSLASASTEERESILGERLYPIIAQVYPAEAVKIIRMILELETIQILRLLNSELDLREKMDECYAEVIKRLDDNLLANLSFRKLFERIRLDINEAKGKRRLVME